MLRGAWTGLSPSKALHSRRLCLPCDLASPDDNSEDFTSELLPLHSPLLRESWLVSFPPPSYMLKFSGYSCLIRDLENNFTLWNFIHVTLIRLLFSRHVLKINASLCCVWSENVFSTFRICQYISLYWLWWFTNTLTDILPKEVQDAFKILMTHWILQFALRIAFRCVLHR